jgi:CRP-like cAMP-binding protein
MEIPRSTYYDNPEKSNDDTAIVEAIATICHEFEHYGWRRVRAALRQQGMVVNHKKIRRLMREHDLQPRLRRRFMDHSVDALGGCIAGYVPHREILSAMRAVPQLTWLFWQATVADAAIARTWITCLGRRSAEEHLAHLVCEIYVRLRDMGQTKGDAFLLPATQSDLADMLGLSTVHVNRTLKDLRAQGFVDWRAPWVRIPDFDRLAAKASFDETYLLPGPPMPPEPPRL